MARKPEAPLPLIPNWVTHSRRQDTAVIEFLLMYAASHVQRMCSIRQLSTMCDFEASTFKTQAMRVGRLSEAQATAIEAVVGRHVIKKEWLIDPMGLLAVAQTA